MPEGFLIVDKPGGMTSHDVVAAVRKASGIRKVGHAGTLDPMATGVIVVAIGRVTRLIRFVQDLPKVYVATAQFGVATDSLDADGAVLEREPLEVNQADVEEVLSRFLGIIEQVPPMVSALKVGGERLYELARRGETVERDARLVEVHEIVLTDFVPGPYPEVSMEVTCGKGTYIRVLADDLARALGGRAHLTALRRTAIGSLTVDRALDISGLSEWREHALSPAEALVDLDMVTVDDEVKRAVRNGVRFATGPLATIPRDRPVGVVDRAGDLLAIYSRRGAESRAEVVLG